MNRLTTAVVTIDMHRGHLDPTVATMPLPAEAAARVTAANKVLIDGARRVGVPTDDLLEGLSGHLGEWGLGSVSETADGAAPHAATGCPFQAWSVAELLRARRSV